MVVIGEMKYESVGRTGLQPQTDDKAFLQASPSVCFVEQQQLIKYLCEKMGIL